MDVTNIERKVDALDIPINIKDEIKELISEAWARGYQESEKKSQY